MTKEELILIVDDDSHLREIVRFALEKEGFLSVQAADGREGLALYRQHAPALVILDILMPEMDGTEVCKEIRKEHATPIIFLSSKDDELDRILGLELGGDDYVTKPFSPRELVTRVKTVLRRLGPGRINPGAVMPAAEGNSLSHGLLRLDLNSFRAYWGEAEIVLTVTEFGLVRALLGHTGKVYSRDELMDRAYDGNTVVSGKTIDSHIRRVRKKFKAFGGDPIETVTGFGYRISPCR